MSDEHPSDQPLPEPVRDHLGQQLRSLYQVASEKPQYLGDETGVPEQFAPQLERLETRLKTHEEGTGAVEQALDQMLDAFGAEAEETVKRPDRSG